MPKFPSMSVSAACMYVCKVCLVNVYINKCLFSILTYDKLQQLCLLWSTRRAFFSKVQLNIGWHTTQAWVWLRVSMLMLTHNWFLRISEDAYRHLRSTEWSAERKISSARIQGISPPPMGELRELYTLSLLSWSPSADKTPTGTPVPALRIMKSFKGSNVELKLLKLSYFETFKL